ncbi:MAG: hypothetical protein HY234_07900 [Acidobacteria bacterium]|nr:hypothetical protein [Acidobacteriota bacterium]MBI3662953.1 hypothetical protein [Acidobacteriota bacterium]
MTELYQKLKPLLEEYYRLNDDWWAEEPWVAVNDPTWKSRHRELKERRRELQAQILMLTQMDRRLIN